MSSRRGREQRGSQAGKLGESRAGLPECCAQLAWELDRLGGEDAVRGAEQADGPAGFKEMRCLE